MILLVAGIAAFILRPKPEPDSGFHPVPLTTYRGIQDAPSFSPDGNQVAFEWNSEAEDNFDIYVKVVGSDSTPLRLTTNPSRMLGRCGRLTDAPSPFSASTVRTSLASMLVPALGGPERKLADIRHTVEVCQFVVSWSSDSRSAGDGRADR